MSDPYPTPDPKTHPPGYDELLSAIALLHLERAALRDELGYENQGRRRVFTKDELKRGATLGPLAFIDEGELVFRLES